MLDEQFSALLDGELSPEETARLLERVKREPLLRATWSRQHLLRAALRSRLAQGEVDPAFAERVMARIQAETLPTKVVDLTARLKSAATPQAETQASFPLRGWTVGFTLAASVALAAVALSPLNPLTRDAAIAQVTAGESGWAQVNEETARELNDYLLDHHTAAAGYGLTAPRGSARLTAPNTQYVAYSNDE